MNRIKELREKNSLTQQELADKINRAKSTISEYEKGIKKPSMDVLIALSNVFGVSIDFILGKDIDDDLEDVAFAFSKQDMQGLTEEDMQDIKDFIEYKKQKKERSIDK